MQKFFFSAGLIAALLLLISCSDNQRLNTENAPDVVSPQSRLTMENAPGVVSPSEHEPLVWPIGCVAFYPSEAHYKRWGGVDLIGFRVLPDGSTTNVRLVRSSSYESLDISSLVTMKRCNFNPSHALKMPALNHEHFVKFTFIPPANIMVDTSGVAGIGVSN